MYLSFYMFIDRSFYRSIFLFVYLSISLSLYLSIYLSIHLSIYLSINPSIYLSIYSMYCLFIYIYTYKKACSSFFHLYSLGAWFLSIYTCISMYMYICMYISYLYEPQMPTGFFVLRHPAWSSWWLLPGNVRRLVHPSYKSGVGKYPS